MVQLLLDTGKVDADSRDKDGQTLSQAAVGGHETVVVRQYLSALNGLESPYHEHECYAYVKADFDQGTSSIQSSKSLIIDFVHRVLSCLMSKYP